MDNKSPKVLSIDSVVYDIEHRDKDAEIWITTSVNNLTDKALKAELTLVLEKNEDREKIEIIEVIEPGINEMESVIRICDVEQWEPDKAYVLMLGLRCEDTVQEVKKQEITLL